MSADKITIFSSLRSGQAFTFDNHGRAPVWIRCRGGFRPGVGGVLQACAPHQPVYRYDTALAFGGLADG